jgi:hypothetical protein
MSSPEHERFYSLKISNLLVVVELKEKLKLSPSQSSRAIKRNKWHPNWKKEV